MASETPAWDEADRLAALRDYAIVDTPTEAVFNDFVQIAAEVCDAPIALVTLVDEHRQWFPAEIGLGIRELPIKTSIYAQALLQPGLFVVRDLTLDSRFDDNPFVTGEPRLRFYAGAVLETPEGLPLGTMCVLDHKPRPGGLTPRQAMTLKTLARQVMVQLELNRTVAEKERLLQEKEILVLEAHHRVKNSLHMVYSLLRLQAGVASNAETAHQLQESAGRVYAFSSMHEHLYGLGATFEIDLAVYLQKLLTEQNPLISSLQGRRADFDGVKIVWPTSEAPNIGLLMIELVTNALKYGAGVVTVTLRPTEDGMILTVEDEGQGLPSDFEPSRSKGIGMRIVTGLLSGRRGELVIDRSCGNTRFVTHIRRRAQKA